METSEGSGDTERLALYSPTILPSLSKSCLTFAYHMYGAEMGTLSVLTGAANVSLTEAVTLWNVSGNQGDAWKMAEVDMDTPSFKPYKVCVCHCDWLILSFNAQLCCVI